MNSFDRLTRDLGEALDAGVRHMGPRVVEALITAVGSRHLVGEAYRVPHHAAYARHLLHSDPRGRYSVMSLAWLPGQCSRVHGHFTWCAFAVLEGELEEALYEYNRRKRGAALVEVHRRMQGDSFFTHAGLDEIHQLRNTGAQAALSLHVYGVDGRRVTSDVNRIVEPLPLFHTPASGHARQD